VLKCLAEPRRVGSLGRLKHYEILDVIGEGGFGTVLKGFDEKLHRVVAIKVLALDLAASGVACNRFLREARSAAAVRHENVVDIHAVEEDPFPYLVMEYIDGQTLQQKMRSGPLEPKAILSIGLQIAEGLAAAHKRGLIHRDVKPANILLENHIERVKLSDFGLARATDDASLSQSGLIAGTPLYMSPEQAEGKHLDQRSDLFSLGSILYALCTGHPPFRADSTLAVLRRVAEDAPRPVRELNSEIPEWLAAVVAKLHAKKPEDRFHSARDVADVLAKYLSEIQLHGEVLKPETSIPATSALRPEEARGGDGWCQRRRHLSIAALMASVLLAGAVLAGLFSQREQTNAPIPPPPDGPASVTRPPNPLDKLQRKNIPAPLLALAGGGDPDRAPEELLAVLPAPDGASGPVTAVTISPDGQTLAVAGSDHAIRLWNMAEWHENEPLPPVRILKFHSGAVSALMFSPDGKTLASVGAEQGMALWDVVTGEVRHVLNRPGEGLTGSTFSPDGSTVASGSADGTVQLWDVATGRALAALPWHKGPVRAVAFSPVGPWLASVGDDGLVHVGNPTSGQRCEPFRVPAGEPLGLAFSSDGKCLAAVANQPNEPVRLWELDIRQEWILKGTGALRGLAFQPGTRLLATGSDTGQLNWCLPAVTDFRTRSVGPGPFGSTITAVAFAPDGRYLATANGNGTITILTTPALPQFVLPPARHLISARELAKHPSPADHLRPDELLPTLLGRPGDAVVQKPLAGLVAVLADRRFLHKNGTTKDWDAGVTGLTCSRDGKLLASSAATFDPRTGSFKSWELKVWDAATGKLLRDFTDLPSMVRAVDFGPDDRSLVVAHDDGTLCIRDALTGEVVRTLAGHTKTVRAVAWSPDGKWIVSGSHDTTVIVWDAADGKKVRTFDKHSSEVLCVAFSVDSTLVTSTDDTRVLVWETGTGKELHRFDANAVVRGVVFSHDAKRVVSVSENASPQVWDLASGKVAFELKGHTEWVLAVDRSPDGKLLVTASLDGSARLWNADTGEELRSLPDHVVIVQTVRFSASGKRVFTTDVTGRIHVWETATGQRAPLQQHTGMILSLAVSPDGKTLASSAMDKTVLLWDLATGERKHALTGHTDSVYSVAFGPDGRVLASGGKDGAVKLWDADTGAEIATLATGCGPVRHLAISADGSALAAACFEGPVKVWDLRTRKLRHHFEAPGNTWCVAFASDNRTLASAHDSGIRVWDTATGWSMGGMFGHTGAVRWLAFHPDGRTLSSATYLGDHTVRLWDLASFREKSALPKQPGGILAGAWRADGGLLATCGGPGGTIRLTDTSAATVRFKLVPVAPPTSGIHHALTLTPDGRHVIIGNSNGTISILRVAEVGRVFQIAE
jgi:WD40 repeat protein/serine/threonine protein kinase